MVLINRTLGSRTMSTFSAQQVLSVHHWNDTLFSFRTTRDPGLRFIETQAAAVAEDRVRATSFTSKTSS